MNDDLANPGSPPPPPPPPLPVGAAEPAPIPVAALAYSTPIPHGRPGILTAVAVISIVIASISGIVSLGTGCQAMLYMRMGRMAPATIATPTPPPPVVAPPATAPGEDGTTSTEDASAPLVQGQDGLDARDRAAAIVALGSLQSLTDAQKHQLDVFLAEHGQDVFPTAGARLTAAQVKAIVTSSKNNRSSDEGNPSNASFVTTRGTFGVYDDKVEFRRAGGDDTITTGDAASANNTTAPANPWGFGFIPLKSTEVQQIIKSIQQKPGVTLNAAQSATFTRQLKDPKQQLVQSSAGSGAPPILNAQALPDGSVWVQFNSMSALTVNPQGQVTNSFNPMTAGPGFTISPLVCLWVGATSLISIGLAILLLIAAIQVMRQASSGKRLHLIWASIQIPAAVAAWPLFVAMYYQMQSGWINGMTPPGSTAGIDRAYIAAAAGAVVVACIYPVALLILFRTRSMRAYYNVVQM